MSQSIFKKKVCASGEYGTFCAEIIATMNYKTKTVIGTDLVPYDNYKRVVSFHKVEVFVDGKVWRGSCDIEFETELYRNTKSLIKLAKEYCVRMANTPPEKPFEEKMAELFQEDK